jgi:branched-chain amino acid aminotransferase
MKVWLNGRIEAAATARIDPADRGLTLGDGLYETFPARGGKPEFLAEHLDRLAEGCHLLRLPFPQADIARAVADLLAANDLADAAVRLTLTRGPGPRGLPLPPDPRPTLLIAASPLAPSPKPARVLIARSTRRNEHSPLARCKTINALDSLLARLEAGDAGADDAVLLNTAGNVAEGTSSNLFVVLDGVAVTPPVADGALPGVRRAKLLAEGAKERTLTVADLKRAARAFLTTSLSVREVAGFVGV